MKETRKILNMNLLPRSNRTLILDDEVMLNDTDDIDGLESSLRHDNGIDVFQSVFKLSFALILLCRRGSMKVKLDMKEYVMSRNDLLVAYPGVICEYVHRSDDCDLTLIALNKPQLMNEPSNRAAIIPRLYLSHCPIVRLNDVEAEEFRSIYMTMRRKLTQADYCFKSEIIYCYLQAMYLDICNLMKPLVEENGRRKLDRNMQIYDMFIRELRDSEGRQREIAYFADKLCLTPKYLSRVVYSVSGRYAKEWIRDYVVLEAKSLLDSGKYNIQQISDILRFANQSFFAKYFKHAVGCSPRAYMER